MPISLYPLMVLPTVAGAMCWFGIKVAMTTAVLLMCFEIVRPPGGRFPPMFRSLILLLSIRPILGDLHHGNNNLLILFLVVSMFYAWRKGWDIGAGLLLALATAYKVTPALFFVYFAYKKQWRTLTWGLLGLGIFLIIVPGAIIGPEFNGQCLGMWFHRMITPFVVKNASSAQEVNQSLLAVLMRLLTNLIPGQGRYDTHVDVNVASLPTWMVTYLFKAFGGRGARSFGFPLPDQDDRSPRPPASGRGRARRARDVVSFGAELEAPLRDALAPLHLPGVRILLGPPGSTRPSAFGRFLGGLVFAHGGGLSRPGGAVRGRPGSRDSAGVWIIPLGRDPALRHGWLAGLGSSSGIELARIAGRTRIADPTLSFHVRGRFSANCRVVIRKSSNFPDVTWPIITIEGEESIEADLGVLFRITVWH